MGHVIIMINTHVLLTGPTTLHSRQTLLLGAVRADFNLWWWLPRQPPCTKTLQRPLHSFFGVHSWHSSVSLLLDGVSAVKSCSTSANCAVCLSATFPYFSSLSTCLFQFKLLVCRCLWTALGRFFLHRRVCLVGPWITSLASSWCPWAVSWLAPTVMQHKRFAALANQSCILP